MCVQRYLTPGFVIKNITRIGFHFSFHQVFALLKSLSFTVFIIILMLLSACTFHLLLKTIQKLYAFYMAQNHHNAGLVAIVSYKTIKTCCLKNAQRLDLKFLMPW